VKGKTYASYGIARPNNNTGASQTCELDHVVPLEIGGADTIDNIWPQCGPKSVPHVFDPDRFSRRSGIRKAERR
jgi:hypothetical protein